jgi:hypothetical protein
VAGTGGDTESGEEDLQHCLLPFHPGQGWGGQDPGHHPKLLGPESGMCNPSPEDFISSGFCEQKGSAQ